MSSGTPDYFRTVRQNYGAAKKLDNTIVATAMLKVTLADIQGKGMIYGGYIFLDAPATQQNDYIEIEIDGQALSYQTYANMMKYNVAKENQQVLYMMVYNEVKSIYAIGISKGITFDTSIVFYYINTYLGTPTVRCSMIYALL